MGEKGEAREGRKDIRKEAERRRKEAMETNERNSEISKKIEEK